MGEALVVEQVLPLANHPKEGIVQQDNLDVDTGLKDCTKLFHSHLKAAVAAYKHYLGVGFAALCADGCGKAEAHRSKAAGGYPARLAGEFEIAGCEHLVLSDVGHQHHVLAEFGVLFLGDALDVMVVDGIDHLCHIQRNAVQFWNDDL